MAEHRTKPTTVPVAEFIAALGDARREDESRTLIEMLRRVTGHEPVMWGPSMIGFDQYHYRYASGREGDALKVGFSPRAAKISLYGIGRSAQETELLARLGKHTTGAACVYLNKLADIDLTVLESLFRTAYATM
jgi:hypothetical protein